MIVVWLSWEQSYLPCLIIYPCYNDHIHIWTIVGMFILLLSPLVHMDQATEDHGDDHHQQQQGQTKTNSQENPHLVHWFSDNFLFMFLLLLSEIVVLKCRRIVIDFLILLLSSTWAKSKLVLLIQVLTITGSWREPNILTTIDRSC